MGYDKQRFLNMLAMGMCSKARVGTALPPSVYLAAGQTKEVLDLSTCITFSSAEPFTLATKNLTKNWNGKLYYYDGLATWSEWNGTEISSIQHGGKQKIYIRGRGNSVITGEIGSSGRWVLNGTAIECSGNIENLLDYEEVMLGRHPAMAAFCYQYMFYNCDSLTTAPELPATTLAQSCYNNMFYNCDSLTTAPELPATTLAPGCYAAMFYDCDSLTTAPELPATTLAQGCYSNMFWRCVNLTKAPSVLPATTLASGCYYQMFAACYSLTTAPELSATTLAERCCFEMFDMCRSLTKAPSVLPATTLAAYCYDQMFSGCTSLVTAPELPATTLAESCCSYMFSGCTSLTTGPELPATTLAESCYDNMFFACKSLTTLPKLPATDLNVKRCYYSMFAGCFSIKLSTTQTEEYTIPYRIPTEGTGTVTDYTNLKDMFKTGGTFTGTPSINTTYYLHNSNTVI